MTTADHEHHESHTLGHLFMGLLAIVLAAIAAYLWLTDPAGTIQLPLAGSASSPAPVAAVPLDRPVQTTPPTVVERNTPPKLDTTAPPLSMITPPAAPPAQMAPPPVAPVPTATATAAPAQRAAPPSDSYSNGQVAQDAAAVGMTARVRPAQPGQ